MEIGRHDTLTDEDVQWQAARGYTVYYLLGGETAWDFDRHASRELVGGQLLLVPREMKHRIHQHVNTPCKLFWMAFNPSHKNAIRNTPFTQDDMDYLAHQLIAAGVHVASSSSLLQQLVQQVMKVLATLEEHTADPATLPWLRSVVCQAIIEAARCLFRREEETQNNEYIAAARQYVEEHLDESITVNDIAAFLGYSPSRTYEMFKASTGLTPNDYLLRIRIRAARDQLADPSASVTDVAFATGFSSSQYFARVFRKYTGMSPSAYRRRKKDDG